MDILDDFEEAPILVNYKQSLKLLKYAAILIGIAIVLTTIAAFYRGALIVLSSIGGLLLLIAMVISSIGVIYGIKSILKKEKARPYHFLVLIGNLIISGFFIFIVIQNLMDIMKVI